MLKVSEKAFKKKLKEKVNNGIFALQETHSTASYELEWAKECQCKLLFSHGTSN